jgi:hypothetical protein
MKEFEIENGTLIKYNGRGTKVVIPNSVTSIKDWAFYGCSNLTSIIIGDSVTSIGNCVFDNCSSLTNAIIGNSVTSIGKYAFNNCYSLANITIPDSVTSIGGRVFYNCSSLKTYKDRYFKATNGDMQCQGFQYELVKTYKIDKAQLCECGFHACRSPLDVFNYYNGKIDKDIRLFEVALKGVTNENKHDSKCVGTEITFIRELTISELAELASKNNERSRKNDNQRNKNT